MIDKTWLNGYIEQMEYEVQEDEKIVYMAKGTIKCHRWLYRSRIMGNLYSVVGVDVLSNTIFLTDVDDGSCIAINPDCWGLIKEMADQQIADDCLDDKD